MIQTAFASEGIPLRRMRRGVVRRWEERACEGGEEDIIVVELTDETHDIN
jgi:hypothetical protein